MAEPPVAAEDAASDASIRFFEDRHIDAQMRALIPRFTYLAVALTVVTAGFATPDAWRAGALVGNALVALAIMEALSRAGLLQSARPPQLYAVITLFVAQIALGCALSQQLLAYGLLQVLPIVFAAVFFDRPTPRYALAVMAAGLEYAAMRPLGDETIQVAVIRLLCYLLIAHFGVAISGILREALRTHRSLYSVLEAATERVDEVTLADRALEAALSVADWHAGGVALSEDGGPGLHIVAMRCVSAEVAEHYRVAPLKRGDGGLVSEVIRTNQTREVADVSSLFQPDHPLMRDGIVALAGTPIHYHGEVIGALVTFHRAPRRLDDRERDRLIGVAEQLGLALGSARAQRREASVAASLRELNQRKDSFLAAVSHELRTPAATIELAARTLQRGGDRLTSGERCRVQSALVDRSRDMRELIEALLDVALTESGESRLLLEPVQWVACARRWTTELEQRLGRPLVVTVPDEEVVSYADPAKMERVVFALVSNAVKFSFDDSPVSVRLAADDTTITLAVHDDGMGILPGDVERIFDPFLQLDGTSTRAAGGLGIGLTLVRHFTALHGGRVDVDSEVGVGSTFTVTVPRRHDARV